jgi:hypothetical protein
MSRRDKDRERACIEVVRKSSKSRQPSTDAERTRFVIVNVYKSSPSLLQ